MIWKHSNLMKDARMIFFHFTLFFAVRHQKTEISGQATDCSGGQSLEGGQSFSMGLAEADHRYGGTGGAHVLSPLQAFYP